MRIAIHQPYFIPYAGYFRSLAAVDLFVVYDDVQFIKGGWIHRNRLQKINGDLDWLTLPLKRKSLNTKIKDMEFSESDRKDWYKKCVKFESFKTDTMLSVATMMATQFEDPMTFLFSLLGLSRDQLMLKTPFIRSSDMDIDPSLKGAERVMAICEKFKATEYINASGGVNLYDGKEFEKRNIKLKILKPYRGKMTSILDRLTFEKITDVKKEIEDGIEFIS